MAGIEFIPEEWVHSEPIEERIRPRPPPLPRAAVERIKRIEVERIGKARPRGVPPPLPPEARAPRLRRQPPPLPPEARMTRPRAQPPPLPPEALRPRKDEWGPGTKLPKAPATINWTLPAVRTPANRNLSLLEHAQQAVEARAIAKGDAKSWYTTAAFEIRRAEITGDTRLLQSALLSLDFAARSVKSFAGRVSPDRAEHVANIRKLRELIGQYQSQGLPAPLK